MTGRKMTTNVLLAAALAAMTGAYAQSATFTYTNPGGAPTDNWSAGTNWSAIPLSAADTELVFGGTFVGGDAVVSNNDNGGTFLANVLTLGGTGPVSGTASLTIQGNPLQLTGTSPTVNLNATNGTGLTYTVSNPLSLGANALFTGNGNATFNFSGPISGSGGITKTGSSTLTLSTANTFTGPTLISTGTLSVSNANGLATSSSVALGGGTLRYTVGSGVINNLSGSGTLNVPGNSNFTINQFADGTWAGSATDNRNGQIVKNEAGVLTLTAANALQVEVALTINAGEIILKDGGTIGINRTLRSLTLNQGSALTLDNTDVNNTNRINNGSNGTGFVASSWRGATLNYIGNDSADSSEVFNGSLNNNTSRAVSFVAGSNVISVRAGDEKSAILIYANTASATGDPIPRSAGATILYEGTQLGLTSRDDTSANRADSANIVFQDPAGTWTPTLTDGIMKGFYAASIDPTTSDRTYGLATYDKGASIASADDVGIRTLNSGELTANSISGGATTNVKLNIGLINATGTINALHLDTGGIIADGGSQTLTIGGGTVLSTGANNIIGSAPSSDTLAFGSSEAIFYNAPSSTLTINTRITGSGGLTKGGAGTLILANNGASQYTGTTTINGGILSVSDNAALGAVGTGSAIALNNGGILQATSSFTLDNAGANKRNVVVGGTTANTITSGGIDVTGTEVLTVSGVISGVGRLDKTDSGTLLLTGANTFTGGTKIIDGSVKLGAAERLANGGGIELAGGTFDTGGFSETAGLLSLTNNSSIDFGSGASILALSGVGIFDTSKLLSLYGWSGLDTGLGTDQFKIGTSAFLSVAQLDAIKFINPTGYTTGIYEATQLSTGEIVAIIPEPASLALLTLGGVLMLPRRNRLG